MVYVKFESQQPKSLSQLVEELRKVQELEKNAIATLSDAIDAYSQQNPAQDYWEGFLSQVLSLFPEELVKKLAGETDTRETEDLRENVQNLERELAEVKAENSELRATLEDPEAEVALLDNSATIAELENLVEEKELKIRELQKQLTEWESKGSQLANELIESSVGDRKDSEAEIEKLTREIEVLKNERGMIVEGFQERIDLYDREFKRYQQLEKDWGARLAQQAERIQELESREPADIIYERVEAKVKEKSDLYAEFIKLSETAGYLKVTETGEILAAYIGTDNQKNENGRRLVLGKSILKDWQSHFQILHSQSKSEIRKGKRLTTDWELKVTGLPFETIEKLGTYDYTQPPQSPQQKPETKPEIELKRAEPFDALCPEYYVLFNGEEYGRVWRIPGKLPHAWKHNNFGPNDKPFNSPEGAAKALVEIEREADKEDDSDTPEF